MVIVEGHLATIIGITKARTTTTLAIHMLRQAQILLNVAEKN